MSAAGFEIVHSGPYKFHARFVAANGETVWVTESYTRRQAAAEAIFNIATYGVECGTGVIREVDERRG